MDPAYYQFDKLCKMVKPQDVYDLIMDWFGPRELDNFSEELIKRTGLTSKIKEDGMV